MKYVLCHGKVDGANEFQIGGKGQRVGFYCNFNEGLSQTTGLYIIRRAEEPEPRYTHDFDRHGARTIPDLRLAPLTAEEDKKAREFLQAAYADVYLVPTETTLSELLRADGPVRDNLADLRIVCCLSSGDHPGKRVRETPDERHTGGTGETRADALKRSAARVVHAARTGIQAALVVLADLPGEDRTLLQDWPIIKAVVKAGEISETTIEDQDATTWLRLVSDVYRSKFDEQTLAWLQEQPAVIGKIHELASLFTPWSSYRTNIAALRDAGESPAAKALVRLLASYPEISGHIDAENRCDALARYAGRVAIGDLSTWVAFTHRYARLKDSPARNMAREWPAVENVIKAMVTHASAQKDLAAFIAEFEFVDREAVTFTLAHHNQKLRAALSGSAGEESRKRTRTFEALEPSAKAPRLEHEAAATAPATPVEEFQPRAFDIESPDAEWTSDEHSLGCCVCHRHLTVYAELRTTDSGHLPADCASCREPVTTDLAVQILCESTCYRYYTHRACATTNLG